MSHKEFTYHWVWHLKSTPEQIWPWLADTNRFNRDTGIPVVEQGISRSSSSTLPERELTLRKFGVPIAWTEKPFEWIKPQRFAIQRLYHRGPIREMRVSVEIRQEGSGSRLDYLVTAVAKNIIGNAAIPIQVGFFNKRTFDTVIRKYDILASKGKSLYDLTSRPLITANASERLDLLAVQLNAAINNLPLIEKLVKFLRTGDELSLARLRPYALADFWHEDRQVILELFLNATRVGILDFQWDLLCPLCRGAKQSKSHLNDIETKVHCDACAIDFDVNFEQLVELTFTPNPTILRVERHDFCVGGPFLTPHIVMQQIIKPGEKKEMNFYLMTGAYRLRSVGIAGSMLLRVEKGKPRRLGVALTGAWIAGEFGVDNNATIELVNKSEREYVCVLERTEWSDQAVTAAQVIALQTFRDLFAREALRPDERISVGSQTIVFTDLKGSTSLYRKIGDATAFGHVIAHFEILKRPLQEENGALVKTIGDAIMAVFQTPAQGVRFVLKAEKLLDEETKKSQPLVLKAGMHVGPCIAVNQNGIIDYFGTTVNVAARLVNLSDGHDLVITRDIADDPEVKQLLTDRQNLHIEPIKAVLKGLEDTNFDIWRIKTK